MFVKRGHGCALEGQLIRFSLYGSSVVEGYLREYLREKILFWIRGVYISLADAIP